MIDFSFFFFFLKFKLQEITRKHAVCASKCLLFQWSVDVAAVVAHYMYLYISLHILLLIFFYYWLCGDNFDLDPLNDLSFYFCISYATCSAVLFRTALYVLELIWFVKRNRNLHQVSALHLLSPHVDSSLAQCPAILTPRLMPQSNWFSAINNYSTSSSCSNNNLC